MTASFPVTCLQWVTHVSFKTRAWGERILPSPDKLLSAGLAGEKSLPGGKALLFPAEKGAGPKDSWDRQEGN